MVSRIDALKSANNLSDVALLLGVTPKGLAYTIRIQPEAARYTAFTIPKKSGGLRQIYAPEPGLKLVQARLSAMLQDCIADINKDRKSSDVISHGFRRGKSIVTNAQQHCNRRHVFNVDIENFFPTINLGRVRGFFIKNNHFLLKEPVANALAQIACHQNELPQGAPTSPVVSNLIAHHLDIRLVALAERYGCYYSRYADDLTFSTNLKDFPSKIGKFDEESGAWVAGRSLRRELKSCGFSLNAKKTRIQFKQSRQDVTGIIVNSGVNVRREYYKMARAKCDILFKTGSFFEIAKNTNPDGGVEDVKVPGSIEQLNGIMSFIDFVKEARRKAIIAGRSETGDKIPKGFAALYKKFLYFDNFFAPSSPTIVCEGKTDNIYIRLSAMALHKKLSILTKTEKKTVSLAVRLFNYSSTTLRLMGIGGGSGQLGTFIGQYRHNVSGFTAPGQKHPVIVLVDNDSGAKPIYSACASILKRPVTGDEPFYYLGDNLYVVPTPKGSGGVDTMIESFLPPKWLKETLNGKKLNLENTKLDTKTEYGKSLFSEHVIKKNKKKVVFTAFEPLLLNLEAAISDYYKMLAVK